MKITANVKITNSFLKKLERGEKAKYADTEIQGFQVVVGIKTISFYLHKKLKQKTHRIAIGKYPETSLDEARREALKILGSLANYQTPEAVSAKKQPTFEEAAEYYLTQIKNKHAAQTALNHVKYLYSKTINEIKRDDIQKLHDRLKDTPHMANNVVRYVSAAINRISKKLQLQIDNPAKGIKMYPTKARRRFLTEKEAPLLINALQELQKIPINSVQADAILMMVYTGQRKQNVLQMHIGEINNGIWVIPEEKAKAGKDIVVPLNKLAMKIVKKRTKSAVKGQLFCFRGRVPKEVRKTFKRACDMSGVENCRIHDLRRTLGSWMLMTGTPIEVVSKTLGHSSIRVTEQVYAHLLPGKISDATSIAIKAMKAGKA